MILIRYLLIGLIVYLIARSFARYGEGSRSSSVNSGQDKDNGTGNKKVSKEVGEYIDYEEIKK